MLLFTLFALFIGTSLPGYSEDDPNLPIQALRGALTCPSGIDAECTPMQPTEGDFVVYDYRQTYTFVRLVPFAECRALEEVGISKSKFSRLRLTWKEWQARDFPGALYRFRIHWPLSIRQHWCAPQITRLSDAGKRAHLPPLLQALWTLPFVPLDASGVSPSKLHVHPLRNWRPPLLVGEKPIQESQLRAYQATWPKDRSYLSNKPILLYFVAPQSPSASMQAPLYWPIFLQIGTGFEREVLRAVELGTADFPSLTPDHDFDTPELPAAQTGPGEVPKKRSATS